MNVCVWFVIPNPWPMRPTSGFIMETRREVSQRVNKGSLERGRVRDARASVSRSMTAAAPLFLFFNSPRAVERPAPSTPGTWACVVAAVCRGFGMGETRGTRARISESESGAPYVARVRRRLVEASRVVGQRRRDKFFGV